MSDLYTANHVSMATLLNRGWSETNPLYIVPTDIEFVWERFSISTKFATINDDWSIKLTYIYCKKFLVKMTMIAVTAVSGFIEQVGSMATGIPKHNYHPSTPLQFHPSKS